jgi:hypothetical protein
VTILSPFLHLIRTPQNYFRNRKTVKLFNGSMKERG